MSEQTLIKKHIEISQPVYNVLIATSIRGSICLHHS